ncbi:MAG: hypothetical protein ABW040_06105 [Microbacteriaceae bacterium]
MKQRFLHPPSSVAEVLADLLRIAGLVSVVVAAIAWTASDAGVLAFVLLGLVIPRFLGMRALLDVLSGATLLVAGWSSVIDVYSRIGWWDLAVHFLGGGVVAAMSYLLFVRLGWLPGPRQTTAVAVVVLATVIGLAGGAVWELLEWLGHTFIDSAIFVDYDDTIGDMALGGLGSVAAGVLLVLLRTPWRRDAEPRA